MKSFRRTVANTRWVAAFVVVFIAVSTAPVLAGSQPENPPPTVLPPESTDIELAQLPTHSKMVETLAQLEAEEDQRQEMLESQSSIHERERSRTLHRDISSSDAMRLLTEKFATQLQALNSEPVRLLSSADSVEQRGDVGALVIMDGEKRLMEGSGLLQAVSRKGEQEKLDLTLEANGAGYATANSLVDLEIPPSADEAIEVGNRGVRISQAGASDTSSAEPLGAMNVFYSDVDTDTDLLIAPLATGVEIFNQLRSDASPEVLRFDLELPPGASIRPDANGAEIVAADGSRLAVIPPPAAADAQGTYVPVEMLTEKASIILRVEHQKEDFAYPLLVDPIVHDWYWLNWYEGHNLHALSNGAWHWNTSDGPSSSWVYGSTFCIYACWGSGRGLYITTPNGNLPANKWGQWSYSAPNAATYLAGAWVSPFWRDNHVNCSQKQYGQPYDYVGMWDQTSWNHLDYNLANYQGWAEIPMWGRALIIGMGTSSGIHIPCWRDIMAGGVMLWLEDWTRPHLTTHPSSQWMDKTSVRLNVSAYDEGLGVRSIKATAINASGNEEEWWTTHACTGLYEAPCPHTWNLNEGSQPKLNFSPEKLPEGIQKLSVTAYDAPNKPSWTTNEVDIAVDHAPPALTLSGTLTEQDTVGTERPTYTVRADAADGDPESTNPADARAGVTKIIFENDGEVVSTYEPGCATQSCGWFREIEVPATQLPQGPHTLTVKAFDAAGHVETKKVDYATGDSTPPVLSASGFPADVLGIHSMGHRGSFGTEGSGQGQFKYSADVAIDPTDGSLWVADSGNNRIQHFSAAGEYLGQFGSEHPGAVAVDSQGDIYVARALTVGAVRKHNANGEFLQQIAGYGTGPGQVKMPVGLAVDAEDNLWAPSTKTTAFRNSTPKANRSRPSPSGARGAPGASMSLPMAISGLQNFTATESLSSIPRGICSSALAKKDRASGSSTTRQT